MNNKGQVTLFIILGIIVLVTAIFLFFFKSELLSAQINVALEQDKATGDAAVVQQYVSSCLQDVSVEALALLGQHGGYINLSRDDVHNHIFSVLPDSTESDIVDFNGIDIPYWWYEDSGHGCSRCSITTKNMPSLNLMEEQVNVYVAENLAACLDDFTGIEQQGFTVEEQAAPVVETTAIADTVYVQLTYPIFLEKNSASSQLEKWYVEIEVPLENIYNAASEITYMQIADQFLEQITLNIISAYSGLDEDRLPPFAGFSEGYATVFWVKALVKEQLKKYLTTYIPLIQIQGTTTAVELTPATKYGSGFFSMLTRKSAYSFGDISVNFIYDDFPYYFEITPRAGELIRPNTYSQEFFGNILPPIQTNHYNFFYDVSYPVVVSVRDDSALNGHGYTFLYAIEANIRDNRNLVQWAEGKGTFGQLSEVKIGLKEGVPTEYPSDFDTTTNKTIYTAVEEPPKTLICDNAQRISGDISVAAYDGLTGKPLTNAAVTFKCGTYKTCAIGTTDATGHYNGKFPICVGGIVRVGMENYYTNYVELDTLPEQKNSIITLLEPFKELSVSVKFIPTSRLNNSMSVMSLRNLAFDMNAGNSVILTLEKIPESIYETPYSQVVSITNNEEATITLVSGSYLVSGLHLDEKGVIIPALNDTIAGEDIEYPEVIMKPAMLGAVYLDSETGFWNLQSADLHDAGTIIFYLFRMNDPLYLEDLAEMGQFDNYSMIYREVIEPSLE